MGHNEFPRHGDHAGARLPTTAVIACIVFLAMLATGCGSEATPTPARALSQAADSKVLLNQAVDELLRLESAAFSLEHLQGTTALIPGFLEMKKVSGVVDIPDRFRLKVQAETLVPRAFVEINVVVIEGQAYMTDPGTGRWGMCPRNHCHSISRTWGRTFANIIQAVQVPSAAVPEELRGHDTHHIKGLVKSQALADLIPSAGDGLDVELDLWLEQSSNLLLQALITGRVIPRDEVGTVRVLTLDDINVPVEISPPQ